MNKSETTENIEEASKKDAPKEKSDTVKEIEKATTEDMKGKHKWWKVYETRKRFCPTFTALILSQYRKTQRMC